VQDSSEFSDGSCGTSFAVGDAVIAYTDGAAEARSIATGFALGMAGVQKLLSEVAQSQQPATEWPGHMMRRVLDYRGSPPEDDTLVVALYRV
jgi:serine phosphatase RsbU (regulator of sigma subunit)